MNGDDLLLDTNILIYAMKGLANVRPYFDTHACISVVNTYDIKRIDSDYFDEE